MKGTFLWIMGALIVLSWVVGLAFALFDGKLMLYITTPILTTGIGWVTTAKATEL